MARIAGLLAKRRGDRRWDLVLRSTAATALAGIALVLLFPGTAVLVALAVLSLPANSPLSPILPATFEPLIMEAAKYEPVLSVSLVATLAYMYTEYLNYQLYAWVLNWRRLPPLRGRGWVEWGIARFAGAPFTTVVVFAFTPLPFWVARCLAILHRYPLRSYMAATAVGRFPRFLAYAWLGDRLQVPGLLLLAVIVGTSLIVVAGRLARGERILSDAVLDPEPPPREVAPAPEAER
jgi:membrane protein YqaA with SNARE-associated domain